MTHGLVMRPLAFAFLASKPAARNLDEAELARRMVLVFGSWLFLITKRAEGLELPGFDVEALLQEWAGHWAGVLDREDGFDAA